jgi:hypothetical protein
VGPITGGTTGAGVPTRQHVIERLAAQARAIPPDPGGVAGSHHGRTSSGYSPKGELVSHEQLAERLTVPEEASAS